MKNLRPAIKNGDKIHIGKEGSHHRDIDKEGQKGFVTSSGEFLPRSKATAWVKEHQPAVYAVLKDKGALHTTEYNEAIKESLNDAQPGEDKREEKEAQVTDLTGQKCVVIDYGYFMNLARRLAEKDGFGETVYSPPWHSYNPTPDRASVGMGIPGVTHAEDYDDHIDDADVIVFPDVGDMAKQRRFRRLKAEGKMKATVFGMGDAEELELSRLKFKKKLDELGLFQPEWGVVYGIDALRKKCQQEDKLWIKIDSKYRGIKETWYHDTYLSSKHTLDKLATDLGVLRDTFMFIWERPFGKCEGGGDYFMSNGVYLPVGWRGFEGKNEWYICKAERLEDMPKPLKMIHEAMAPYYLEKKSSGKMSDEVRTDEKGKAWWNDATMRFGDPPFGVDLRGWQNLPQIIAAVSRGEMIEPVPVAPYACMIVLTSEMAANEPCPVDFESSEDEKHISLRRLHVDKKGQRFCIPLDRDNIIGSAVGFGETYEKAIDQALYYADRVRCRELSYKENILDAVQKTLETAKSCGWGDF